MKHKPIHDTRFFFATAPLPCPYLPDRVERRVVTDLLGRDSATLHNQLSLAGFRRSHGIVYTPGCPNCQACKATRILVREFTPSRSHRRILNRNRNLRFDEVAVIATSEQFKLFSKYQNSRHAGGDMAHMDFHEYQALIEETPVDTRLTEFRDIKKRLVAVCLADRLERGLSAVYSFFDPDLRRRSLGNFMILQLVDEANRLDLDHVYLGFWIDGCSKMSYKARFQPLEMKTPEGWRRYVPD